MKFLFVLITLLFFINRSYVLSDPRPVETQLDYSRLYDIQRKLRIDPSQTIFDVYPELKETSSSIFYDCHSPYYNHKLFKPFERPVVDVVSEFLSVTPSKSAYGNTDRIETVTNNLVQMAEFTLECTKKEKKDRMQFGLTSMAIYSDEEYLNLQNKKMAKILKEKNTRRYSQCDVKDEYDSRVDEELSWKKIGRVSPVLDQLNCSSDYAFAALSALESQYMLSKITNKIDQFSEQMIINCFKHDCEGGHPAQVWEFIKYYGIPHQSKLPYNAKKDECIENSRDGESGGYCLYIDDKPFSDTLITNMLYNYGPAIAGINTMDQRFKYVKDNYNGPCGQDMTHAVLVAGYTRDKWILKNSWGTNWGDDGYFTIPRNMNKCGINSVTGVPFV